jgi:DNA-binding PadR family transcriptional regulator
MAKARGSVRRRRSTDLPLTTPDVVVLSLLAETPMHGYQVNASLEGRNIRDWAAVSRPQVYYSLDKLTAAGFIRATDPGQSSGPERRVYQTTERGRQRLAATLDGPQWTEDRCRPAFLTWLALSWQAPPGSFLRQLARRRTFLESELARERLILADVLAEVGHPYHEAVWMLGLMIDELEVELRWLDRLEREVQHRAPAMNVPGRGQVTPGAGTNDV